MIKVKVHYPWGERDINYSSWVFVSKSFEYSKQTKEWRPDGKADSKVVAKTQEEYDKIVKIFNEYKDDVIAEFGEKAIVTINSTYYEQIEDKNHKTRYYIQGFLSDEQ